MLTRLHAHLPRLPALLLVLSGIVAGGCGGGGSGGSITAPPTGCTVVEQNQFILDVMLDFYFWNDRMPVADPRDFDSPDAFLDALRVPEDIYSFLADAAEDEAFFGEGQFAGLGLRSQESSDQVRLLDVYEGSPAFVGGLRRGDSILTVDGRPIAEVLAAEGFSASLGPQEIGYMVELGWRDVAGAEFTRMFTKAVVTIPPVTAASVLSTPLGPVGYLNFRNFVEPADPALNAAFADFRDAGISDLIVDLRYNSGGLLSIAELLGDLIGGAVTQGQVFYTLEFNADNAFRNESRLFRDTVNAVDMPRVILITTRSTASASEMVINGLAPFVDVTLVGSTTFGKPVGQFGFLFCDQILRPVTFRTVNAVGTADFFDGFPPDCTADDDLDRTFGDPAEASLAEALFYLENGTCSVPAAVSKPAGPAAKPETPSARRWKLLDAH